MHRTDEPSVVERVDIYASYWRSKVIGVKRDVGMEGLMVQADAFESISFSWLDSTAPVVFEERKQILIVL